MTRKILIIEDDASVAAYIAKGFAEAGFAVDTAPDGREGLFLASEGVHDIIVMDRMLPGMDGLAVLKALRAAAITTPVLILSALDSVDDRIDGLRGGSDDYLTKPFSFAELLARAEALLRRAETPGGSTQTILTVGELEINLLSRSVKRQGKPIRLVAREYNLLEFLARHAGQVVTRTMMLEKIWNYHFDPGTNVVDVHVGRLRRKIDEGFDTSMLHTVRGAGYRLSDGDAVAP
jgi:two-component system OmpR family response regulator